MSAFNQIMKKVIHVAPIGARYLLLPPWGDVEADGVPLLNRNKYHESTRQIGLGATIPQSTKLYRRVGRGEWMHAHLHLSFPIPPTAATASVRCPSTRNYPRTSALKYQGPSAPPAFPIPLGVPLPSWTGLPGRSSEAIPQPHRRTPNKHQRRCSCRDITRPKLPARQGRQPHPEDDRDR